MRNRMHLPVALIAVFFPSTQGMSGTQLPKDTCLGPQGYTIPKSQLTPAEMARIKRDLTIMPFRQGGPKLSAAQIAEQSYPAWRESANKVYLPRHYGEQHFGLARQVRIGPGQPANLVCTSTKVMNDLQREAVDAWFASPSGGILEMFTAFGKTVTAICGIVARLNLKTLITLTNDNLIAQMREDILAEIPTARIGIIKQAKFQIGPEYDIVLASVATMAGRDYPPGTFADFGLLVCDEVHHMSAPFYMQLFFKCVPMRTLGLTARLERSDRTHTLIPMFLGPVLYSKQRRDVKMPVTILGIHYQTDDVEFNYDVLNAAGKVCNAGMISKLCAYEPRTQFIARVVMDSHERDPRQQHAIFGLETSIVDALYAEIAPNTSATCGLYYRSMKRPALNESAKKDIIFATYRKGGEGTNIPTVTTSVFVTPVTDVLQAAGRNQRRRNDAPMLIIDIIDKHSKFRRQWQKRKAFYKSEGFRIMETTSGAYVPDYTKWRCTFAGHASHESMVEDNAPVSDEESGSEDVPTNPPPRRWLGTVRQRT